MASSCGSSYASSLETTNYARMCRIVVDVFRDILWLVLTNEILPADLPQKVQIDIKKLGSLDFKIKTWLCGISPPSTEIPSAENFDVSSLYALIRNLCSQVPAPSTQWGQIPPAGGITLGDNIERVRGFRNTLHGHATQAKIETVDFNKLCIEIKDVASRFDAYFCSLSKAMKCDFECEIDTILTCFMDKSLEDDYIEKIKQIIILSDCVVDVQQKLGDLTKTVYNVEDVMYDLQKDGKENAEDSRNRLCRIQETLDMLHMEKGKFEKDKVKDTACSLVNEERDCNENAGISHEDIALEMPQGMEGKICIIKCYADLKLELERDIVMDIAKDCFQKKKHKDVLEDLRQAGTRRLCIDRLLKRVLQLKASRLKIFFDLLKRKCPEIAQKLAEIKVTDKDREDFTQVSKSVKMVPHRIQNGLKFEQRDVEFFQCRLLDIPEKVDEIADVLLSQFHISICNHSQLMQYIDPVEKMHALLEKVQSCHFDSDSEVQSMLGSSLYDEWQSFRDDGSRQGLENQGIWHYLLERIQSSVDYLIEHFRGLRIYFLQARRGSLVLKFVTLDNFDVKLLKPEAVKTKVWDMIKTLCPEYQDIFKEPVHLTIFFKPLSNTDSAEIHFYLETSTEKEEFSCMKLGSHDKQYIVEEMGPVSLTNWMFNTLQLDEDTKAKLVDLVSTKDMSRRNKMKFLLNIVESLGNGYELLEKYCEEHDTFLYAKVFKKHRQMMVEENPDGAQQYEFSEEGLQRLSSTWIDYTVDPKDDIGHVKQQVGDVKDQVGDVKDQVGDVKDQVGDEKDQVGGVKDQVVEWNVQVGDVMDLFGDVKYQVGDVNDQVGDVKDQVGDVKDQVGDVNDQVGEWNVQGGDVKDQVGDVKDQVRDVKDQVGDVKDHVGDVKDHVGDVKDQVGEWNVQGGDVKDQVGDVKDQVRDVKDQVGDVKDHVGDVKDHVGDVKDQVGEWNVQGGDVNGQVGDVKDQVGDVKNQVPEVKDQVGDVKDQVGDVKDQVGEWYVQGGDVKDQVGDVNDQVGDVTNQVGDVKDQVGDVKDQIHEVKVQDSDLKKDFEVVQNALDDVQKGSAPTWNFKLENIRKAWQSVEGVLSEELSPKHILDVFTEEHLLSPDECQDLRKKKRREMSKELLQIVKDDLPDAFFVLLKALEEDGEDELIHLLTKIIGSASTWNFKLENIRKAWWSIEGVLLEELSPRHILDVFTKERLLSPDECQDLRKKKRREMSKELLQIVKDDLPYAFFVLLKALEEDGEDELIHLLTKIIGSATTWNFNLENIRKAWKSIEGVLLEELSPRHILDVFTKEHLISPDECQDLLKKKRREMSKELLQIVKDDLPDAFFVLLKALKEDGEDELIHLLTKIIGSATTWNFNLENIRKAWQSIEGVLLEELSPRHILDVFTKEHLISPDECQDLLKKKRREMSKELLQIVKDDLPDAFFVLLKALKEDGEDELIHLLTKIIETTEHNSSLTQHPADDDPQLGLPMLGVS